MVREGAGVQKNSTTAIDWCKNSHVCESAILVAPAGMVRDEISNRIS